MKRMHDFNRMKIIRALSNRTLVLNPEERNYHFITYRPTLTLSVLYYREKVTLGTFAILCKV